MPPRPELGRSLGVTYRRIPVLAIGRDVYCDTSLITLALERRFSPEQGYGTLFPSRSGGGKTDTGLLKAFSKFYADRTLFPLAVTFIEWDKLPKAFVEDRSKVDFLISVLSRLCLIYCSKAPRRSYLSSVLC
jgi:glutathione S-transferase